VVSGDYLPIQIIESQKLSQADNLWLKSLNDSLEKEAADAILRADKKQGIAMGAYLEALSRANAETFLEVNTMPRSKRRTFEEVFTEAGYIPEWMERGEETRALKIARNLLNMGMSEEETAKVAELPLEKVHALIH
jgi:hypothetical protein